MPDRHRAIFRSRHLSIATESAGLVASPRFRRGFTAARPMRIEGVG